MQRKNTLKSKAHHQQQDARRVNINTVYQGGMWFQFSWLRYRMWRKAFNRISLVIVQSFIKFIYFKDTMLKCVVNNVRILSQLPHILYSFISDVIYFLSDKIVYNINEGKNQERFFSLVNLWDHTCHTVRSHINFILTTEVGYW